MAFDPLSDPNAKAAAIDALIKKDAEEKARKDEDERKGGETLDKLLSMLTSVNDRMDAWEEKDKSQRADAEAAAAREPSDPEQLAADSDEDKKMELRDNKLCDANGDPIPMSHAAKVDAAVRVDSMIRSNTEASYRNDASTAQARCDRVTQIYSQSAPPIMAGESVRAFKVRLLNLVKHASPAYKGVESAELAKMSPATFAIAENTIYADADKSGRNPAVPEGQLVEYYVTDQAGRKITMFAGESKSWFNQFAGERRRLVGIKNRND
jgi:hypothetical protein